MKEQFVTYEIALKLKELDFDEECFTTYDDEKKLCNPFDYKNSEYDLNDKSYIEDCEHFIKNSDLTLEKFLLKGFNSIHYTQFITAPIWQQAIDWLRENYSFHIQIHFDSTNDIWEYRIYKLDEYIYDTTNNKVYFNADLRYSHYFECREQSILKAIELCQNKK